MAHRSSSTLQSTTTPVAAAAATAATPPSSSTTSAPMIAIDFPTQIDGASVERAVQRLGGPAKIVEVVTNKQRTLEVDLFNSRLAGSVSSNSTGLLLKVTKTRRTRSDDDLADDEHPQKRSRVEVVGRCPHRVRFKGLRDFSLFSIPRSSLPIQHQFDSLDSDFDPTLLPPLEFSPYSLPREYRFAESVADRKTKAGTAKTKGRRRRGAHNDFFLNWDDPVPKEPRPDSLAARPQYMQHRLTTELKMKFLSRPIWSSQAIFTEMKGVSQKELIAKLLRSVAYRYRSGPWRFLWIRFGYEPKKHPESAKYQVVDYRMKPDATKAFGARPKFRRRGDWQDYADVDHTFATVPTQMGAMFQLCDLSINEVAALIQKIKPIEKATQSSGWISPAILDKVRSFMTRRIQFWMKQLERGVDKSKLKVFPKRRSSAADTTISTAHKTASPSKPQSSSSTSAAASATSPTPKTPTSSPLVKSGKLEASDDAPPTPPSSRKASESSPSRSSQNSQASGRNPALIDPFSDDDDSDDSDDEDESEMESDDDDALPDREDQGGDVDFPLGQGTDEAGVADDLMDDEDDDGGFDLFG